MMKCTLASSFRNGCAAVLSLAIVAPMQAQQRIVTAAYKIQALELSKNHVLVQAIVPSDGDVLTMADSRPGDVPEVADAGWPALVKNLEVADASGQAVDVASTGATGWKLARPVHGPILLKYEVDYSPLAARGWPAQREAAFADADHFVVIGRSLFIRTPAQEASNVSVTLRRGWSAVMPWPSVSGAVNTARAASTDDLSENLVVFMRGAPDLLTASGFKLRVVSIGHWQPARSEIRRALGAALQGLVSFIGFNGSADYLVVLMPQVEHGGESFRESFALNSEADPTHANVGDWGNTIAHEVFHYWNGWRLKGADYASSQWFQEGFTEYSANLALVSSGLISPEQFEAKLASHVTKYRRLTTPLDAPGSHKGQPLYSGGALVAFSWDVMIRDATRGRRGIFDVMRTLLANTNGGDRRYTWADIEIALNSVAHEDWAGFHRRYISGTEPLPLDETFARVGLRMLPLNDSTVRVIADPSASTAAVALRREVMGLK